MNQGYGLHASVAARIENMDLQWDPVGQWMLSALGGKLTEAQIRRFMEETQVRDLEDLSLMTEQDFTRCGIGIAPARSALGRIRKLIGSATPGSHTFGTPPGQSRSTQDARVTVAEERVAEAEARAAEVQARAAAALEAAMKVAQRAEERARLSQSGGSEFSSVHSSPLSSPVSLPYDGPTVMPSPEAIQAEVHGTGGASFVMPVAHSQQRIVFASRCPPTAALMLMAGP